ncbi:hypothetical protein A2866_01725 [Candidatus Roizmanbacteria bacterium RIFCSPHIGHO2_01_FULL_39_8]|nr:MAG: hypothetical protein A2866_01725 [Candidatus Roizmanbacteria bacterium RIFCSPHIGHO2_01_FULL_39_8]OGK25690.1 MAG: hypothetical protein A3C28_01495 [Candidatus Roizmanbacteria bacterium RIFCSPHIGHO2_02_FULL_39_9]
MVNELVDREDTDKYSWNPVHIGKNTRLNMKIVGFLFFLFTILGLLFSYLAGFFWWGILLWIIGIMYSLKPVRLKARFGLDILAQISCAIFIPFLAPISTLGNLRNTLVFTLILSLMLWSVVFPYQLADYEADVRAGLKSTHVVLGMKNSLIFGFFLVVGSVSSYVMLRFFNYSWSIFLVLLAIFSAAMYLHWYRMKSQKKQQESMQSYVRIVKPLSQILPFYFLVWMFITKLLAF